MNKTVVALSISTALFAASTAYLALELHRRGDSPALMAATPGAAAVEPGSPSQPKPADDSPATRDGSLNQSSVAATSNAAPSVPAAAAAIAKARDPQGDPAAGFARQMVARYDDPDQRPAMLEEQRSVVRRQYEKLQQRLKLNDSEFSQLVTLIAEEQLQLQMNWARCAADPACDTRKPPDRSIDRTQEYQAMLGSEGAEALAQFRRTIVERETVIQLRGRLPDTSFLPESQAEKLVMALAEEREKFSQEATARGAKATSWGTNLGLLMYTEDSGLTEQYVAEATQYSQRLRARAASVLTPAQLAAYVQMQEELLAMFTTNVRPPQRQQKTTVAQSS
jgi:hypothetical protein